MQGRAYTRFAARSHGQAGLDGHAAARNTRSAHIFHINQLFRNNGRDCVKLRLQVRRDRRGLMHQRDGDPPIGRDVGVVRKQGIGIGLARHRVEIGYGQAFLFQNLAHRVGAVGGEVPRSVIGRRRLVGSSGVAGDGDPVRRRLQRPGDFLDDPSRPARAAIRRMLKTNFMPSGRP
jgi:hypothetical protein